MSRYHAWVLSDSLPGHFNQSLGMVRALESRGDFSSEVIEVSLRGKALRPLMRALANGLGPLPGSLLRIFYQLDSLPRTNPDVILSAGGNTLFANVLLGWKYHCPSIFSGTPKGYKNALLDIIFTVTPLNNPFNNVVLDLPPANVPVLEDKSRTEPPYLVACLIGGDGAGYSFDEQDWQRLINLLGRMSSEHPIQWLISTSRRTGKNTEKLIEALLETSDIEVNDLVLFGHEPRKVVREWLQHASMILTTEDSLTMVAEAILSGKSVCTLQPAVIDSEDNDELALQGYSASGYITRHPLDAGSNPEFDPLHRTPLPDIDETIFQAVMKAIEGPEL